MKPTKKLGIGLFAVALAAVLGCTTAAASGHGHGWYSAGNSNAAAQTYCAGSGYCLRDTDGDGICDVWAGSCGDGDGDGICDLCGRSLHMYTDANGDGVCDHWGACSAGSGGAAHHGGGHHHGGRWSGTWTSA